MNDDKKKLSEKDFINESYSKDRFPIWLWISLVAIVACLLWGYSSWIQGFLVKEAGSKPFLDVTNREMSIFLWNAPTYMRSHVKSKTGYLTGFKYQDKDTLELATTEDIVVAPPELLFLYHTWHRLVGSDTIARPIPLVEFREFLNYAEEWQPSHWKQAPPKYAEFVESLSTTTLKDLQMVPEASLPQIVRQAFLGWKNYFKEGPAINTFKPTYAQVQAFLEGHPFYARNYWRNIQDLAGPHYLETLTLGKFNPTDIVPEDQVPPFLKVALFNAKQSSQ